MLKMAKEYFRATIEHMISVIKRRFVLQKTWLQFMLKNRFKVLVPEALSDLFMARYELLCRT